MGRQPDADPIWAEIRLRVEAGESSLAISRETGKKRSTIDMRARREGWDLSAAGGTTPVNAGIQSLNRTIAEAPKSIEPKKADVIPAEIVPHLDVDDGSINMGMSWTDAEKRQQQVFCQAWRDAFAIRNRIMAAVHDEEDHVLIGRAASYMTTLMNTMVRLAAAERRAYAGEMMMAQQQAIAEKSTTQHERVHREIREHVRNRKRSKRADTG